MTEAQLSGPAPFFSRVWAPLLAGIVIGAFYWLRVDSVFYFLHGAHSQGLLLADAVANGLGFIDLSLPGHPAHVREPPLLYLMIAGVIRVFGLRMFPIKVLIWSGYVAAAVFGAMFFQRRVRPWLAFLAIVLFMTVPDIFKLFTGPATDIWFMALCFASLLGIEVFSDRLFNIDDNSPGKLISCAVAASFLIICAIFIRSLGIALIMGACGALIVHRKSDFPLRRRTIWAAVLAVPVVIALGAWALRGASVPNPAGYDYIDWFLMSFAPDSPEMIAVDFHAPLMGEIQRVNLPGLIYRGLRHSAIYIRYAMDSVVGVGLLGGLPFVGYVIAFCLLGPVLYGLYKTEKGRSPLVLFFLCIYFSVIIVWPMDDPRLTFPLLPFISLYFATGLYALLELIAGRLLKSQADAETLGSRRAAIVRTALALLLSGLIGANIHSDFEYHRTASRMPTASFMPGFDVRFMNGQAVDSFALLLWARDNIPPEAILMYHSPPPCRLFTGHMCRSIPFTDSLEDVRDYIVGGGADYLVIDEWGKLFLAGPGWFTENVLRPAVRAYPSNFETVYEIPGTGAKVVRVRKKSNQH